MTFEELLKEIDKTKLGQLSREDIEKFVEAQERVIHSLARENNSLKNKAEGAKQKYLELDGEYIHCRTKTTETKADPTGEAQSDGEKKKKKKKETKKVQLPSERYPEAEVTETELSFRDPQSCSCCSAEMSPSGLFEVSEVLTVTPAVFKINRIKREKLRCSKCYGDVKTAPALPRIVPGGSYSDEMIIDVVVAKYCDLIPIERYAQMAARGGLKDLPPQSLIQLTHYCAAFIRSVYDLIKKELLQRTVLHADETPHRMLEQWGVEEEDKRKSWYLWGFSDNLTSSYLEVRNTRSGDVASELLSESNCEYLVSDVFSGYNKSVRQTNEKRAKLGRPGVFNIYCNAHAYRKFKDLKDDTEFEDIRQLYKRIYRLEGIAQRRPTQERLLKARAKMTKLFEEIKALCLARLSEHSSKSAAGKAMSYFLKNYESFTRFISLAEVPIDNNPQERQLRSPVVGRKTWYGNHSLKGANTTAVLFSVIQSCKLCGVNPREYLHRLVEDMHQGKEPYTPATFKGLS
jgi:transposase